MEWFFAREHGVDVKVEQVVESWRGRQVVRGGHVRTWWSSSYITSGSRHEEISNWTLRNRSRKLHRDTGKYSSCNEKHGTWKLNPEITTWLNPLVLSDWQPAHLIQQVTNLDDKLEAHLQEPPSIMLCPNTHTPPFVPSILRSYKGG